jgi:hypothetical protein
LSRIVLCFTCNYLIPTSFVLINVCFIEYLHSERPNLELFYRVKKKWKGGQCDDEKMMKTYEISNTWERNITKASTGGEGGRKMRWEDFIPLDVLIGQCTETSLGASRIAAKNA